MNVLLFGKPMSDNLHFESKKEKNRFLLFTMEKTAKLRRRAILLTRAILSSPTVLYRDFHFLQFENLKITVLFYVFLFWIILSVIFPCVTRSRIQMKIFSDLILIRIRITTDKDTHSWAHFRQFRQQPTAKKISNQRNQPLDSAKWTVQRLAEEEKCLFSIS